MLDTIWVQIEPHVITLLVATVLSVFTVLGTVATLFLRRAEAWAKEKFNLDLEEKHREVMHKALATGVAWVAEKMVAAIDPNLVSTVVFTPTMLDEIIKKSIQHGLESSPDAINFFKPQQDVLERIAMAKLSDWLAARNTAN